MEPAAGAILEVGLLLLAAVAAGWVARRLTLPAIVGYLAVGIAVSPFTPGYVADEQQLLFFAQLGAVLLLFEVGIETDLRELRGEQRALLWAAPAQLLLTTAIAGVAFAFAGLEPAAAALLGLAVAMSSSIVVVNITRSRRRTTDRATEVALVGWAVLQDVVGVLVAVGILAMLGEGRTPGEIASGLVAFAVLVGVAARVLPVVLARLRDQPDLFLLLSVAAGLALAGIGAFVAQLPLALSAFVAGLAITNGDVAAEARARLLPFRDLFAVFFFVSIGALLDPAALVRGLPWLGAIVVLLLVAKTAVLYLLARVARLEAAPGQLAVGLSQLGEFSFVLASVALARGAIPAELFGGLLGTVVVSIVASTIIVRLVPGSRRAAVPVTGA